MRGQAIKGKTEEKTRYIEKKPKNEVPKKERPLKDGTASTIEVKSSRRAFGRPLDLKLNRSPVDFMPFK